MEQPGPVGDPYTLIPSGTKEPGSAGVALAWDATRYFYGRVVNQAWWDMQAIQGIGGVWV